MKWIIPVLIVLILTTPSLADKLKSNEYMDISGKNVTLVSVGPSSIKVSVNGQGAIMRLDETNIIKGIKITVLEIFYADDPEINYADITASSVYVCGDNKCDEEEKDSCCLDCKCAKGYECDENKCKLIIIPECKKDIDCDDKNSTTEDKCKSSKCIHTFVCTSSLQCKDKDECTKDYCEDGTCFNEDISGCGIEESQEELKPEENTEKIIEEVEEVNKTKEETQEIQEEKIGFFSKMINFFKNLFKK
ncbi:hypothetical protein HYX17_02680 [Candidatus Woesearchaeota archaeon]|nr:hypothetical protein [Candidatus Woesearchaeota archaeon]